MPISKARFQRLLSAVFCLLLTVPLLTASLPVSAQETVSSSAKTVTAALQNTSSLSRTSLTVGETVSIRCSSGGGSGTKQFLVRYQEPNSTSWKTVSDYSAQKTVTFQPAKAGQYTLRVRVKDAAGQSSAKDFVLTVRALPPVNTSSVSDTAVWIGDTVTVRCSSRNGSGEKQYRVLYQKQGSTVWKTVSAYSARTTVSFRPPAVGEYTLRVRVKDAEGRSDVRDFPLKVVRADGQAVAHESVKPESRPNNIGLSAHCLKAYRENWQYVWGGSTEGYVDCSGLIVTYRGVGGIRTDMLYSCQSEGGRWGYVSNGIPHIHGLGLHSPGHVGVYVGYGMAVDARDVGINVCYQSVGSRYWAEWFMITDVYYPRNGWVLLDGKSYYYENGEYLVNTARTMYGVTYFFDKNGVSSPEPPNDVYVAADQVRITAPAPALPLKNTTVLPQTQYRLGEALTGRCQAVGGVGQMQYRVLYQRKGESGWVVLSDYSSVADFVFAPKKAGTYVLRTKIRDESGKAAYKDFEVTFLRSPIYNISKISAVTAVTGETVTVSCKASCGTGVRQYKVLYQEPDSDKWRMLSDYSAAAQVDFRPVRAGTYTIRTKVRDSAGEIGVKDFTLTVSPS